MAEITSITRASHRDAEQDQRTRRRLAMTLTSVAIGVAACGGDSAGDVRTVTVPAAETSSQEASTPDPVTGDPILIQTRITNAREHEGKVLASSVIGESAFCRGGKTSGGSDGPTITTTFRCPGGTLTVRFAPMQPKLVQSGLWEVVSGTGSFKGLRGGGSMVARFKANDPDEGGETFTGTVGS